MKNTDKLTTEIATVEKGTVENLIYIVRGQKVMLDVNLAKIYGYSTKAINQHVKNNIEKFNDDFMFQMTDEEVLELSRSKNLTLNAGTGHGTEQNLDSYFQGYERLYFRKSCVDRY